MITLAQYSLNEILPHLGSPTIKLHGYNVNGNSVRLRCLKRSQACVWCKRTGNIFLLQTHSAGTKNKSIHCYIDDCPWCNPYKIVPIDNNRPHLNLYYVSKGNKLTLMTRDHI